MLNELKGWPILTPEWKESNVDVTFLLGQMIRMFGDDYFVAIDVSADPKNSGVNKLWVK